MPSVGFGDQIIFVAKHFMDATPFENGLMQYWRGLSVVQQEAVLRVIKSMIHPELNVSVAQYSRKLTTRASGVEAGYS
jgi:hypothetical protein